MTLLLKKRMTGHGGLIENVIAIIVEGVVSETNCAVIADSKISRPRLPSHGKITVQSSGKLTQGEVRLKID